MLKLSFVIAIFLAMAVFAVAQTATKKPTTHRAITGPTHVVGPGVTTPSGLKYWNIRQGTGAVAEAGKKVKVDYTGWLTNGKKFDSSVGAQPFEFTLGNHEVIKGWDEGIAGMKVGGRRQLRIPPDLAYGVNGTPGGPIPPNATLIFDVRLVAVE
ncbi:MAG TPA: FKBP-type peptidyl-prolyl cis-trans isomerase [Terriglobales bacterium]|nr:FKBP-type peptidyl-prolyl cis-trans isomerase [Terriglobales bacterium]